MKPLDSNMMQVLYDTFDGSYKAFYKDDDIYETNIIISGDIKLKNSVSSVPVMVYELFGNFDASGSDLMTLSNMPQIIHGNFDIHDSKNITSLDGSPISIDGDYNCSGCSIKDFNGLSTFVGGSIYANNTNISYVKDITNRCDFKKVSLYNTPIYENYRSDDYFKMLKTNNRLWL